jgi:hypothetical protein
VDNPTYIRPQDWPRIDSLVDWLIEKNKAGYQMVNSVQRLQEIKAFIRMACGSDLKRLAGTVTEPEPMGTSANGLWACLGLSRMLMATCTSPNGTAARDRTT